MRVDVVIATRGLDDQLVSRRPMAFINAHRDIIQSRRSDGYRLVRRVVTKGKGVRAGSALEGHRVHQGPVGHDLVAMERIGAPQPSPDGNRVAFVVTTMDLEANRGRTDLWLVGVDGTRLRRLTRQRCDLLVRLPMFGTVESLNVSVATGICLYEAVRQRRSMAG